MYTITIIYKFFIYFSILLSVITMVTMQEQKKTKKRCKKVCRDDYELLEKRVEQLEEALQKVLKSGGGETPVILRGPKGEKGDPGSQETGTSQDADVENQGPPGPRGFIGLSGPKGRDGSSMAHLPVCLAGEYITSDGTNLFCAKLGNIARPVINPSERPTQRPSVIQTILPDGKQPHPPVVIENGKENPDLVSPQRQKFVQKYDINTLYADAWDLHSFTWKGNSYLGVSQLNTKSFILYKWVQSFFVEKAVLNIPNARKWKSFEWNGDLYLVIACFTKAQNGSSTGSSYVYKLKSYDHIELYQTLETDQAFGVDTIEKHGHLFIVFSYLYADQSDVFKYHNGRFVKHHKLPVGGRDIEGFHIGHRTFVAVVGVPTSSQDTFIFEYRHGQFQLFRKIPVGAYQPTAIKYFKVGNQHYLAVARYKLSKSVLLKWNGEGFEESQQLDSCKARGFSTMTTTDETTNQEHTYLAVTNYDCKPVIYVYNSKLKVFEKLQQIDSKRTRDIEFLKSDSKHKVYMAVSTNRETTVYSREEVG